jgi:hypothetical protein
MGGATRLRHRQAEETVRRFNEAAEWVPLEPTNKRKASDGQQEQPGKKNKNEQEERGLKRGADDWHEFAKDLRTDAERKAEESKEAKVGGFGQRRDDGGDRCCWVH